MMLVWSTQEMKRKEKEIKSEQNKPTENRKDESQTKTQSSLFHKQVKRNDALMEAEKPHWQDHFLKKMKFHFLEDLFIAK